MSNILDIPQVPTFDPGNLQNDLHIGFGTDISQRFKAARWTDETHAKKTFPDNVDAEIGAYLNAFSVENQAYVIAQKSQIVKQRTQVDHERDALYKEVRKTVDTFATLSIFPAKQSGRPPDAARDAEVQDRPRRRHQGPDRGHRAVARGADGELPAGAGRPRAGHL